MTIEKNRPNRYLSALMVFSMVFCLAFGRQTATAIRQGLSLCCSTVIPALFPFLVFSDLLLKSRSVRRSLFVNKLSLMFRTSPAGAFSFVAGALCGYPIGVRTLCVSYRQGAVSKEDACRLLMFVNNAGPAFLVAGVGYGMLDSAVGGWILYICQLLSAVVVALMFRPSKKKLITPQTDYCKTEEPVSLVASINSATQSILHVCGMICFFSLIGSVFLFFTPTVMQPWVAALIEITEGTRLLHRSVFPSWLSFGAIGAAVSFGGLCVHAQTRIFLEDTDLPYSAFLAGKCLCAVFSFLLCIAFYFSTGYD